MIVAYTLSFLVAAMYGLSTVIEKYVLKTFSPHYLYILSGLIFGIASLIYLCFHYDDFVHNIMIPEKKKHCLVVIGILLAMVIPMYIWYNVLHTNSSKTHVISAISFSAPMFTLLFVALFLDENITRGNIIGVMLVVAGTVMLMLD